MLLPHCSGGSAVSRAVPGQGHPTKCRGVPGAAALPSSLICSYFRMAMCRRQAFWITRAKPSNFRSRISSRRKSCGAVGY